MNIITNYLTKNDCYIYGMKIDKVYGIVVHSTGANNPYLKRYVQSNIEGIGKNQYNNDWNRSGLSVCVHAFIGKLENGNIATLNTLPYNICAWGVGRGSKGSFNYNPTAKLQFEICEDDLTDRNYFDKVMKEAQEYCAYLCKKFNLKVNSITSHQESYRLGFASNHADPDHWLKKFGKDMNWFRSEVQKLLDAKPVDPSKPNLPKPEPPKPTLPVNNQLKVGDKVKIIGPYAGSVAALVAIHTRAKGQTRYITKIHTDRKFPYQIGNKGKIDGKNTTGFAKAISLQKV